MRWLRPVWVTLLIILLGVKLADFVEQGLIEQPAEEVIGTRDPGSVGRALSSNDFRPTLPEGYPPWAALEHAPRPADPPGAPRFLGSVQMHTATVYLWEDDHGLVVGPFTAWRPVDRCVARSDGVMACWGLMNYFPEAILVDPHARTVTELNSRRSGSSLEFYVPVAWLDGGRLLWRSHFQTDSTRLFIQEIPGGPLAPMYEGPSLAPVSLEWGREPVFVSDQGELVRLTEGSLVSLVPNRFLWAPPLRGRSRAPADERAWSGAEFYLESVEVSPGGRWLVAGTARGGTGEVVMVDRATASARPVAPRDRQVMDARFSPNGSYLAVLTAPTGAEASYATGLHVLDVGTGGISELLAETPIVHLRWLDDRWLAASGHAADGKSGIWLVDAARRRDPAFRPMGVHSDAPAGFDPWGWFLVVDPKKRFEQPVQVEGYRFISTTHRSEEQWVVRVPAEDGSAELVALRGELWEGGGRRLLVVSDPWPGGVYVLDGGAGYAPLSGPLRAGARVVGAGGGYVAYTYAGYEGYFLRIRPLKALTPSWGIAGRDLLGPMPDKPPVPPGMKSGQSDLWHRGASNWAVREGALGFGAGAWVWVANEVLLEYRGPALTGATVSQQRITPTGPVSETLETLPGLETGWTLRLRPGTGYFHEIVATGKTADGRPAYASVGLRRVEEEAGYRRLASGASAGLMNAPLFDGGHQLFLAGTSDALRPVLELARRISSEPVVIPQVDWGREVVLAIFRGPASAPVKIQEIRNREVMVEYPAPGDRWSYDVIAVPRNADRWEYVTLFFVAGPDLRAPVIGGVSGVLPPPSGGAEGEAEARAFAEAGEVLRRYLAARVAGDTEAATSYLAEALRAAGPLPELVLPFPPGTRLEVVYVAAASRVPADGRLTAEACVIVETQGKRAPLPWRDGWNVRFFTFAREDGWRLVQVD